MRAASAALPGALLAVLVLFCSFRAGGLGADITGAVCVVLIALLAVYIVAAERPFATLSKPLALATGAMTALAALSATSAFWSDTPARAISEATRPLVYALILLTFGLLITTDDIRRRLTDGLTVAATTVCLAALASRVVPELIETTPNIYPSRLSWPITYWNALGLMAVIALTLLVHTGATARHLATRAVATGLIPAVAATLLLTYSRGSIAVAVLTLLIYTALARSAGLAATLIAAAVPTAVAVGAALSEEQLATTEAAAENATGPGLTIAAAAVAAAGLRLATQRLEPRLRLPTIHIPRRARIGAAVVALLALATTAPTVADRFAQDPDRDGVADARQRLLDPSGGGRDAYWDVALDAFADAPLIGTGAGSFRQHWLEQRPVLAEASRAHSLELETLADLGLLGFALLTTALAACAAALWRLREDAGTAALTALAIGWLLHASIDWDWHLPAVTLWLFAVGGAALAERKEREPPSTALRGVIAVTLLAAAVPTAAIAIEERSVREAETGSCAEIRDALGLRPEAPATQGICAARDGDLQQATTQLEKAERRAPGAWEYPYARAVIAAASGDTTTAAAAANRARQLNPLNPDVQAIASDQRKRRAMTARLFLNGAELPPLAD